MKTKEKWFVIITLFYIAYMVFPPLASMSGIPIWLICSAVSLSLIVMFPDCFRQRYFRWFFVYFSVLFLYLIVGHPFHINGMGDSNDALWRLTIEIAWILPNLLICSVIMKLNDRKVNMWIGLGTMVLLAASVLVILPMLFRYSRILRENTSGQLGGEELLASLPGYTLMSSYIYIVPVFCYGIRRLNGVWKVLPAAFLALFAYAIVKTEITTSLVMLILLLLFTIVYQKEKGMTKTSFAFIIVSFALLVMYEMGVISLIIKYLSSLYEGTAAESKFVDFHNMLEGKGKGNNLSVREYCRQLSLACFYKDPLFGSPGVGGHSSLLDRLGSMGLFGFIPYLLMLIANVRAWYRFMPKRGAKFFYISGIIVVFIFLYMKGLFGGEGMLFMTVLLPISMIGVYEFSLSKNTIGKKVIVKKIAGDLSLSKKTLK